MQRGHHRLRGRPDRGNGIQGSRGRRVACLERGLELDRLAVRRDELRRRPVQLVRLRPLGGRNPGLGSRGEGTGGGVVGEASPDPSSACSCVYSADVKPVPPIGLSGPVTPVNTDSFWSCAVAVAIAGALSQGRLSTSCRRGWSG